MDSTAPREFAPGIWWLPTCLAINLGANVYHAHIAQFLVVGADKTLLFDTAMPAGWDIINSQLDGILQGRPLDYVAPSHPEVPHCANALSLLEKYPDAIIVGDVRNYPLYYPTIHDRLFQVEPGSELDLGGGYRYVFLPAVIKDLSSSQWGFERSQQVLFVSDAFICAHHLPPGAGYDDYPVHLADECTAMTSELASPPLAEQLVMLTRAALTWPSHVHIDRYRGALQEMLREYAPAYIAPAHGPVIDQPESILPLLWDALRQTYEGPADAAVA